jgi:YihY family inner membrane protein
MNKIQSLIRALDTYQQRHSVPAFGYAVVKKYSEDQAGYQAVLLTYYAFLSLFPLLLVLTTLTGRFVGRYPHLQNRIINGVTGYFPLLGNQLAAHVHGLRSSGLALAAGILFTLYGTRGVAAAFRQGVQHIWHIPHGQREGFPKSTLKNLSVIVIGGLGFLLVSLSAVVVAAAGHGWLFRVLAVAANVLILFWLFAILINFSLPRHITLREIRLGAAMAAVGLAVLQLAGNYLLARELKNLDALYSYFAVALGLLFWIYLQAQILYYAMEIAVVGSQKLWPRSLDAAFATPVDEKLATNRNDY